MSTLAPGTIVRFDYRGYVLYGVVVKFMRSNYAVECLNAPNSTWWGQWTCPPQCLAKPRDEDVPDEVWAKLALLRLTGDAS